MNVESIISAIRESLGDTATKHLSDETMLRYINITHQELVRDLIMKDEIIFTKDILINAIENQSNGEYIVEEYISKLKRVYVNILEQDTFILARKIDLVSLSKDWDWYLKNQDELDPIYFEADGSVFIAPQFTSERMKAGNQIKLNGVEKLKDLYIDSTEEDIKIPTHYHWMIILGVEPWVLRSSGRFEEARTARKVYDNARLRQTKKFTK